MKTFEESAVFEHTFWLQVLGDHARFIRDSLYPQESKEIEQAKSFRTLFDDFLHWAHHIGENDLISFTNDIVEAANKFRDFKLSLLENSLKGKVKIHLSPTFINHMVNELDEYITVLQYLKKGKPVPIFHELHHHLIWLQDAYGHSGAINDELDGVEKRLKEKSKTFTKHFEGFYLKAVELTGYLRTNLKSFPALDRFNKDVEIEMALFRTFLQEVEELELSEKVLSTFSALMADHMAREECYYLIKLAESSNTAYPNCDPAKPRTKKA
ncbi:hypothetical protein HNQ94_002543 [Salirhabdus euzebyi]|uniref:DUF2935 domain-containing protein n=1 Tax=Salirhabdus euzebyi TaxID=394506 RepID=A0A841Q722_9BACI|nr:DUF2935 domain-containing protein [Salirhabdus euzebyi]MBB6454092.1 hypothetical protein [Salirhabdus euzebyi]